MVRLTIFLILTLISWRVANAETESIISKIQSGWNEIQTMSGEFSQFDMDGNIENGKFSIAAFLVLDRGIPREENEIFFENNVIGKITSGTHSPTLKSSIAIGLIKRDFNIVNNKVRIKVRDKFLEAEIRKLPMYRRRRK